MFYQLYELNYAALQPFRAVSEATKMLYTNPLNPWTHTPVGRMIAAWAELFERSTRRYAKPSFDLPTTKVDGKEVKVIEEIVWNKPFCNLIHFKRELPRDRRPDPKLLIVAPMSGHYATLLRGTVETMLPNFEVYITDWVDARMVPNADGAFGLDDYVDYVIDMLHALGEGANVIGVCQPSVPVLAAAAVMEAKGDKFAPATMTLMGGPIDTRRNPTAVNLLAEEKGTNWFRDNVIMQVPWPLPGAGRDVYPGFLQLSGFMSMNLDRHIIAHKDFFMHLVKHDGDSAEKHRDFYDEYLAVMDLTAEFYLQTVDAVFVRHLLPKGELKHRGELVDCSKITNIAVLAVEGENDDISGLGQTQAVLDLCVNLSPDKKAYYMQPDVGHYGVFNGSRFRAEIAPRIRDFIDAHKPRNKAAKPAQLSLVQSDDLRRINGLGAAQEKALRAAGVSSFAEIAAWTDGDVERFEKLLSVNGRIGRERWLEQAALLAKGDEAGFAAMFSAPSRAGSN